MRTYGWCELGFQEGYFVELLMRSGWLVTKINCPMTDLGSCYIAERNNGEVSFNKPYLLDTMVQLDKWHSAEDNGRWTKDHSCFTLDLTKHKKRLLIELCNYLPKYRVVNIKLGSTQMGAAFDGGEQREITLETPEDATHLEFTSKPIRISEVTNNLQDNREVGIFVTKIKYIV